MIQGSFNFVNRLFSCNSFPLRGLAYEVKTRVAISWVSAKIKSWMLLLENNVYILRAGMQRLRVDYLTSHFLGIHTGEPLGAERAYQEKWVTSMEEILWYNTRKLHIGSYFIACLIIWPAPWAGEMNQILRCDWLPERARWSYLDRSRLLAVFRKKNFPESHIISPLLLLYWPNLTGKNGWILA